MGSSTTDGKKAAVAGLAFIRIFLGLFFVFSAAAKLLPVESMPTTIISANTATTATNTAGTATRAPINRTAIPANTSVDVSAISADAFIAQIREQTGVNGQFSSKDNVWPWYKDFLRETVSPHAELFGWLVIIGEGLIGFLLVIGLFTRLSALIAMLMSAAYLLATMHLFPPVGLAGNAGFLIMEFGLFIGNAGKTAGLDATMGKKKKASDD